MILFPCFIFYNYVIWCVTHVRLSLFLPFLLFILAFLRATGLPYVVGRGDGYPVSICLCRYECHDLHRLVVAVDGVTHCVVP